MDGDARKECLDVVGSFVVEDWASKTPNSLIDSAPNVGEGSADEVLPVTWTLVRRLFKVGEFTVEDLLAIRGILVGVSFGKPDVELFKVDGGGSLEVF